jgi:hypothetical protein
MTRSASSLSVQSQHCSLQGSVSVSRVSVSRSRNFFRFSHFEIPLSLPAKVEFGGVEKGREAEPLLPSPGRHPLGVASRGTHGCTTLDGGLPTLVPPFQRNKANNQKSTISNDQNQLATTRTSLRLKNQLASPRISLHLQESATIRIQNRGPIESYYDTDIPAEGG